MDWFVLPHSLSDLAGRGRVKDAVPDDAIRHDIEFIWVPVWRVEVSGHGVSFAYSEVDVRTGPDVVIQGGPDPDWPPGRPTTKRRRRMGASIHHSRDTHLVCARLGFPIRPNVKIRLADLQPGDALDTHHVVPDYPQQTMEQRVLTEQRPLLGQAYIDDARLCFVPLYVQRYRMRDDPSVYWAAVDGFRGKVASANHQTLGDRLKQFFT